MHALVAKTEFAKLAVILIAQRRGRLATAATAEESVALANALLHDIGQWSTR